MASQCLILFCKCNALPERFSAFSNLPIASFVASTLSGSAFTTRSCEITCNSRL